MKITLKKLNLFNFKGGTTEVEFANVTNIFGDNATGKTRIFDAFMWLMFGKDSSGRADFEIKPVGKKQTDVEVRCELLINDRPLRLGKVYKEKWQKKGGVETAELTGHETIHYLDNITVSKSVYDNHISTIIKPDLFKLITNPFYFVDMDWRVQRTLLFKLIAEVDDKNIAEKNGQNFVELLDRINGRDIAEYKKNLNSNKRVISKDIEEIPPRIDELQRSKTDIDFVKYQLRKDELTDAITIVDDKIRTGRVDNSGIVEKINAKQSKIQTISQSLQELFLNKKTAIEDEINAHNRTINTIQNQINQIKSTIEFNQLEKEQRQNKLKELSKEWDEVNNRVFKLELQEKCPTCERPFNEEIISAKRESMFETFNSNKAKELTTLNEIGAANRNKIVELTDKIEADQLAVKELTTNLKTLGYEVEKLKLKTIDLVPLTIQINPEIIALKEDIRILQESMIVGNNDELDAEKTNLQNELNFVNVELSKVQNNIKVDERINELNIKMKQLAQEISNIEKDIDCIDQFIKLKVDIIENQLNFLFSDVKIQLFKELLNGELEECCIILYKGVPYNSVNYSGKVIAGLEIIKVISAFNDINAPLFIDNRESITTIPVMNNQIINLTKTSDQELRIVKN